MPPLIYRPLTQWPAGRERTVDFKRATFKAGYQQTLEELNYELDRVEASGVVLQVDVRSKRDIRADGWMGVNMDAATPAVVLGFEKSIYDARRGWITVPVSLPCDAFDDWRDNVRAILLGLRDLRRLDRYGIVQHGEQYRGFAQLPSATIPAMNLDQASEALSTRSAGPAGTLPPALILGSQNIAREAARIARNKAHPDTGGSSVEFATVQEAARVLAAHFGVERL